MSLLIVTPGEARGAGVLVWLWEEGSERSGRGEMFGGYEDGDRDMNEWGRGRKFRRF